MAVRLSTRSVVSADRRQVLKNFSLWRMERRGDSSYASIVPTHEQVTQGRSVPNTRRLSFFWRRPRSLQESKIFLKKTYKGRFPVTRPSGHSASLTVLPPAMRVAASVWVTEPTTVANCLQSSSRRFACRSSPTVPGSIWETMSEAPDRGSSNTCPATVGGSRSRPNFPHQPVEQRHLTTNVLRSDRGESLYIYPCGQIAPASGPRATATYCSNFGQSRISPLTTIISPVRPRDQIA
jgi:hypothetical protein